MHKPVFPGNVKVFYGPPGTGKTEMFMNILEKELAVCAPEEIAFISFTREGARQGIRRACKKFDYVFRDFPYFRTIHSIAFHELKLTKDQVMTPYHYHLFGQALGMHFAGYCTEELHSPDDRYLFLYDLARNNKALAEKVFLSEDIDIDLMRFVVAKLAEFKKELGVLDYTDMVTEYLAKGEPLPIKVGFLDEAQDLATLHYRGVEKMFANAERIYIAGDDDQAIYSWSGADVEAFLSIEGEHTVLNKSHRLPTNVLAFAKTITAQINFRSVKEYTGGERGDGSVSYYTRLEEVDLVRKGTTLILVRNTKFIKHVTELLRQKGLYYQTKEGPSVTASQIGALRAWEAWRTEGKRPEPVNELRIKQATGQDYHNCDKTLPWYDCFIEWDIDTRDYIQGVNADYHTFEGVTPPIKVATIHTVKGGEADHVVLLLGMSKLTYESYMNDPDPEHRVFYVGATRAKETLHIVYTEEKYQYAVEPDGGV